MVRKKTVPQSSSARNIVDPSNDASSQGQSTSGLSQRIITIDNDSDSTIEDLINDDSDYEYVPTVSKPKKKVTFVDLEQIPVVRKTKPKPKKFKIDYGTFQGVLDNSLFSVVIHTAVDKNEHCLLGILEMNVSPCDPSLFDNYNTFWLYVCKVPGLSSLYFENNANTSLSPGASQPIFSHCPVSGEVNVALWKALSGKRYFHLNFKKLESDTLYIDVSLLKSAITELSFGSEYRQGSKCLELAIDHFYKIKNPVYTAPKVLKHEVDIVFKYIKEFHLNKVYSKKNVQHPKLIPTLRPYQQSAVQWMLHQESDKSDGNEINPLYEVLTSIDGTIIYYNVPGGFIVAKKPLVTRSFPGGILADEMGLGKTVEVLACILCNPRQEIEKPEYKESIIHNRHQKLKSINLIDSSEDSDQDENIDKIQSRDNGNGGEVNGNGDCLDILTNKRKRKRVNYSFSDDSNDEWTVQPKIKKKKTKPNDIQKEIDSNSILATIQKTIVDSCYEGRFSAYKKDGSHKEFCEFLKMRKIDPFYMMTLRERLNLQYLSDIQEYSASNQVIISRNVCKDFFETTVKQKSYFECVCGKGYDSRDTMYKIQCSVCSLWQHSKCTNYDIADPYRGEYVCPHCWTTQKLVCSKATLIIAPSTITYQWVDEIKKHIKEKSIRMLVYNGVSKEKFIQPRVLANYDIVITAYETLKKELDYVDLPHSNSAAGRRFRYPKRFMATPSPLPCVEWWRICLDEAQMVENLNKSAEMALRLSGINRWCVTGTPFQKSIEDLQGLLTFLGVDPYGIPQWWKKCVFEPFCHGEQETLLQTVSKYMWRNSKADVMTQLDIPDQSETIHWLTFSPVEDHFYNRLHKECSTLALQKLKKFTNGGQKLGSLDRKSLGILLMPLLKLRQACNHPQVVRGQFNTANRKNMTMEELLENLIKKASLEAEEAHRVVVSSLNGLAALFMIEEDIPLAVDYYRQVIQSVEEHVKYFKTDSLQRLHTFHNLNEALQRKIEGVHPTLRDDSLSDECKKIREKYLKQYPVRIQECLFECEQSTNMILGLFSQFNDAPDWWTAALESFNNDFVLEVREEILSNHSRFEESKSVLYPVKTRAHLMHVLKTETQKFENQRKEMIQGIRQLLKMDQSEIPKIVDEAIDCHLRPTENSVSQCRLCAFHDLFETYEQTLFFMKENKHTRETDRSKETRDVKEKAAVLEAKRKGNWGQSDVERVLKYLQTKSLSKVGISIYEDSQTYFDVLVAMKKEFKNYRILWRAIFDHISAHDEVNMATLRLRLRFPDEELPKLKKKDDNDLSKKVDIPTYILERCDLDHQRLRFDSDLIVSKNDLKKGLRQLLFLENLRSSSLADKEKGNVEACPVCQGTLGEKWAVYECGHSFCLDCTNVMANRTIQPLAAVKCAMCRKPTRAKDIFYVQTKVEKEEETVKVQGSLSTKVEGVVRVMLDIKAEDPQAKVLIFSKWSDVLVIIADALAQNGIMHRVLHAKNKFQDNLAVFKTSQEITALLMPIYSGANGLNLTEASHILLVEPILNPASELQALGRIHRMGQIRATTVHRLIVKNTIEERMHHILSPHVKNMPSLKDNSVTIGDLRSLFVDQDTATSGDLPNDSSSRDPDDDDLREIFEHGDML